MHYTATRVFYPNENYTIACWNNHPWVYPLAEKSRSGSDLIQYPARVSEAPPCPYLLYIICIPWPSFWVGFLPTHQEVWLKREPPQALTNQPSGLVRDRKGPAFLQFKDEQSFQHARNLRHPQFRPTSPPCDPPPIRRCFP